MPETIRTLYKHRETGILWGSPHRFKAAPDNFETRTTEDGWRFISHEEDFPEDTIPQTPGEWSDLVELGAALPFDTIEEE